DRLGQRQAGRAGELDVVQEVAEGRVPVGRGDRAELEPGRGLPGRDGVAAGRVAPGVRTIADVTALLGLHRGRADQHPHDVLTVRHPDVAGAVPQRPVHDLAG